jgi:hypothetical protein
MLTLPLQWRIGPDSERKKEEEEKSRSACKITSLGKRHYNFASHTFTLKDSAAAIYFLKQLQSRSEAGFPLI